MKKKTKDSFEEWARSQGLTPTQALDLALVSGGTWYDIGTRDLRPLASVKRLYNFTKLDVFKFTEAEEIKYSGQCLKKPLTKIDEQVSAYLVKNYYHSRQAFTLPGDLRISCRVKVETVRATVSEIIHSSNSNDNLSTFVTSTVEALERLLENGDAKKIGETLRGSAKDLMRLAELTNILVSPDPLGEYKRLKNGKKTNFLTS